MATATAQVHQTPQYELIDAATLAERWHVSERFIKEYSRPTRNLDPIPLFRLHRRSYLYAWGSPELEAWFERRKQKPVYQRPDRFGADRLGR